MAYYKLTETGFAFKLSGYLYNQIIIAVFNTILY